jgi:hypothetical protein
MRVLRRRALVLASLSAMCALVSVQAQVALLAIGCAPAMSFRFRGAQIATILNTGCAGWREKV